VANISSMKNYPTQGYRSLERFEIRDLVVPLSVISATSIRFSGLFRDIQLHFREHRLDFESQKDLLDLLPTAINIVFDNFFLLTANAETKVMEAGPALATY
jgi:hypothetical protein